MSPTAPSVILVRPREDGNVGAACRAMANMGLHELRLVAPVAPLGEVARAFAVGGYEVLAGAQRFASLAEAVAPFARVIGTTSARDRRLGVPVLTPRELAAEAEDVPTALVFGPEVGGLNNDELALCQAIVTIPAALAMPTLNLAQAVLIVAYELFLARSGEVFAPAPTEPLATAGEVAGFHAHLERLLERVGFHRSATFGGVLRDLQALFSRAGLNTREVKILRGVLRRTERALDRAADRLPGP